ncbi:predicted protein [Lichtheimia corymbifera JMRC:FSU:9682]|uniref:Uncharacterized protein n=1 Tax=Lichtheimia corymbifera JMRC:FSU:9682 TaxID=1263082 RepID=A0A068S862_9FUNG|nr:predicted protein [Lichtheimia corymbifera JMRC:FSU:9682]
MDGNYKQGELSMSMRFPVSHLKKLPRKMLSGHADHFRSHKASTLHHVNLRNRYLLCFTYAVNVVELLPPNGQCRGHYKQGDELGEMANRHVLMAHVVDRLLHKWDDDDGCL